MGCFEGRPKRSISSTNPPRRTAGIGAFRLLLSVPAKVRSVNPQPALGLGDGNWSFCPVADTHDQLRERKGRVDSGPSEQLDSPILPWAAHGVNQIGPNQIQDRLAVAAATVGNAGEFDGQFLNAAQLPWFVECADH